MKNELFENKTILVTGGTGSFGKRFIGTVLKKYKPKKIIIYSRDELKQYEMQNDPIFSKHIDILRFFIGDVRDFYRLKMSMSGVDYVVHAAAIKQVPAAEYNPFEAVKTNVFGGQNVIDACLECGVKKVIALSTDKAAAPTNLYGATKLTSDKLFVAANNHKGEKDIKFSVVRYGNVMGSRGSVIPFFIEKMNKDKLPITDERMTRFSITLDQGVNFVLESFYKMWGGETFVPKIPSYRILDVARAIAPNASFEYVGIRPGEKLHEEMITATDSINTIEFDSYFVIVPTLPNWNIDDFISSSNNSKVGKKCKEGFSYNSLDNNNFLNTNEIKKLIEPFI